MMARPVVEEVRRLDELLLQTVPGQEPRVAAWIAERKSAVQEILDHSPTIAIVEELQARTRRLDDRFLHWRRSAITEMSLIDQHLRFLNEQRPGADAVLSTRFNLSA